MSATEGGGVSSHIDDVGGTLVLVLASVVVVVSAVLLGYVAYGAACRRRCRRSQGSSSSKEGFVLNDQGVDLTCAPLYNNVNRFGYSCGLPSPVLAHWKFDSIAPDGSMYDVSSNKLHLRKHGNPQLRYDEGRQAIWLDGSGDHFTLRTPRRFMGRAHDGFAVSFWYKQTSRGPSHYEPFVLLYKDEPRNFVAVTDHWSDHRVDIKTNAHGWLATTRPRNENAGQWTHCVASIHRDKVRLVLSRERLGDVDDRTQGHDLSKIDYAGFDKVSIGAGPGWVIPSRTVRPVQAYISDVRVFARPMGDEEMAMLLHMSAKNAKEVVSNLEVRGDTQIGGNANVQHRLHFRDPKMDPSYNWKSNNSDTYFLEKKEHGRNRSSLDLTINDDANERFRILGNSCREGPSGCGGPGAMQHEFRADGRAYHKGDVVADGNLRASGDARVTGDVRAGGALMANGNVDVRNPGGRGGSRGHDGGRLHTFYRGTDTHLSLEEYDDNVFYDMKTHRNGDVASLMKTRNGDVYIRNRGGFIKLRRDGVVEESGRRALCLGGKCMREGDLSDLLAGRRTGDFRATGDVLAGSALRADNRVCLGDTCIDEADLRNLKSAKDLDNLDERFASAARVDRMAQRRESRRSTVDDRLSSMGQRRERRASEFNDTLEDASDRLSSMASRGESREAALDDRLSDMANERRRLQNELSDKISQLASSSEDRAGELNEEIDRLEQRLSEEKQKMQEARSNDKSGPPIATVYKHCWFRGRTGKIYEEGIYDVDFVRKAVGDNQMSGVKVADGYRVRLYARPGFQGRSLTLNKDEKCLLFNNDFNDKASSLIVQKA